jgi:hypothetical protein
MIEIISYIRAEVKKMKRLSVVLALGLLVATGSSANAAASPFDDIQTDQVNEGRIDGTIRPPVVVTPGQGANELPPPPIADAPPPNAVTPQPTPAPTPAPTKPAVTPTPTPAPNPGADAAAPTPPSTTPKFKTHKVGRGDTLWGLAAKYLGDGSKYPEIIEFNKAKYPSLAKNPNLIIDGWILAIPEKPTATAPTTPAPAVNPVSPATGNGAVSSGNSGATTEKTLTTEQKVARLQQAIDQFIAKLKEKGKQLTELNEATVRIMIDEGFIKGDSEWMALNPPIGYRWAIENGKIKLVKTDNKPITDPIESEKPLVGGTKPAEPSPAVKPQEPKNDPPKVDEAKVESFAEKNFLDDIKKFGVPNLMGREKEYVQVMEALNENLGGKLMTNSGPEGMPQNKFLDYYHNICILEKNLKAAHQLYERKVQERDVNRFLGIFGDDIESAGKKVLAAREALSNNWTELKGHIEQARQKVDASKTEADRLHKRNREIQDRLNMIQNDPSKAAEVQKLYKEAVEVVENGRKAQAEVARFELVKKVFG